MNFNKLFKNYWLKLKKIIKKIANILGRPEMSVLPGQLAFFLILSLVPIITLIGYGASLFGLSSNFIIEAVKNNFNVNIADLIIPTISGNDLDFKLVIILIIMFYVASNGADSIIVTCNEIYNVKQTSWFKRRIKAIILTFIIVILYLFILIVPVFGNQIISAIDYFNLKTIIANLLLILQGPISWIIIFIFIKVIYMFSLDYKIPSSSVNVGSLFTTINWIIVTEIYGYYITHLAKYDLFYAGLSNIAILMLWAYFLSYIFVIGLIINSRIDTNEMAKTGSIKL